MANRIHFVSNDVPKVCPLLLLGVLVPAIATAGPAIERWRTEEGLRVYFIAAPELPMVDVRMVFDAGSARDGANHGIATLTNTLLIEGADGLVGESFRVRLADLGAQYRHGVTRDNAWVGLRSLSDKALLEQGSELLAKLVSNPDFLPEPFVRERTRQVQALRERRQSLHALAADAFFQTAFSGHPYGSPELGDERGLTALSRTDAELFHARFYSAQNCFIAIIGDLTKAGAEQLATRLTEGLPHGQPAPPLPDPPARHPGRKDIAHNSTQTHVWFGQAGFSYTDPDYFALYVGNHVLGGGGFTARLMQRIREEQGLAYSAYSYFRPLKAGGPFVAGVQTRNESLQGSLTTLKETINTFIEEGLQTDELDRAKKNIVGSFPLRIDNNRKKLGYLMRIGSHDLPLDYLDEFIGQVEALTIEDVQRAFRRRLDPATMTLITVGAPADTER